MPDAVPQKPNPGSIAALAAGCECAVLANNEGRTPPYPPQGWLIAVGCPVHDPRGSRVRVIPGSAA